MPGLLGHSQRSFEAHCPEAEDVATDVGMTVALFSYILVRYRMSPY